MWCQGAPAWMDLAAKAQEVIVKRNRDEEKEWREGDFWEIIYPLPQSWFLMEATIFMCGHALSAIRDQFRNGCPTHQSFLGILKLWKRTYHLLEAGPCGRSQYVVRSNKVGTQKSSQDKIVSAGLEYLSCSCNQLYPCPSLAYLFNLSSYFMSQFLSISKTS